jgi:hypothetical protein
MSSQSFVYWEEQLGPTNRQGKRARELIIETDINVDEEKGREIDRRTVVANDMNS